MRNHTIGNFMDCTLWDLAEVGQRQRDTVDTCVIHDDTFQNFCMHSCVCMCTCVCWAGHVGSQKSILSSSAYSLTESFTESGGILLLASPVLGWWRYAAMLALHCRVPGNELRSSYLHSKNFTDSHRHSPACIYKRTVFHVPSPRFYRKSKKSLSETGLILCSLASPSQSDLTHFQFTESSRHFQLSSFALLFLPHCSS